jgi:dCMP deaminase
MREIYFFFLNEKTHVFIHEFFPTTGKISIFTKRFFMSRPDFDDIFMELAVNLAKRSHCIKKHVGAVLTKETRIISIGYNGPPAGTHNCDLEFPETGCARDSKGSCSLALHAEQNAILYAVKNNTSVDGSTLYVTLSPCLACSRIIFSMGISKVVYLFSYAEYKGIGSDEGVDFLRKFGVEVEKYSKELETHDQLV